jgi:hypothetical protein
VGGGVPAAGGDGADGSRVWRSDGVEETEQEGARAREAARWRRLCMAATWRRATGGGWWERERTRAVGWGRRYPD